MLGVYTVRRTLCKCLGFIDMLADLLVRVDLLGKIALASFPAPQTDILEVYFEHILRHNLTGKERADCSSHGTCGNDDDDSVFL